MVDIYVFRHGETDWNKEGRFQGHTDIPLNQTGRDQAQLLSDVTESLQAQIILCSDSRRAVETAQFVNAKVNLEVVYHEALRECRLGDPEGMLIPEILQKYGADTWEKWRSPHLLDFAFPNGESKREHTQRMKDFLSPYLLEHSHLNKVLLSTHGGSLRALAQSCVNSPFEAVAIPNCALYHLQYKRTTREWFFVQQLSPSLAGI